MTPSVVQVNSEKPKLVPEAGSWRFLIEGVTRPSLPSPAMTWPVLVECLKVNPSWFSTHHEKLKIAFGDVDAARVDRDWQSKLVIRALAGDVVGNGLLDGDGGARATRRRVDQLVVGSYKNDSALVQSSDVPVTVSIVYSSSAHI